MSKEFELELEETAIDFVLFETKRLFVREFNADDVEAVLEYSGDAENTAFMEWGPSSRESVEEFIASRLASQIASPRKFFDLAVCLNETGELIGSVGLYFDEAMTQADLGYIFNKRFWGNGYASEAARGMLRFGFMNLDLHRITAKCDSENLASEAVMKRIGMRKEGETKKSVYTKVRGVAGWRSEKHYAMLQKEFLNALIDSE
ncbi:MAG: GNAT family N-acetyltransferase [Clostridia bacterium]|nr:GNAT family N-acetyltransferase [Clostridia bacterium]